jgi:arylsulfatase A-like enzyme
MKQLKRFTLLCSIISALVITFNGCYPISTGAVKWRIKWDKDLKAGREDYLESLVTNPVKDDRPNIIILLADDLGKYEVGAYGSTTVKTPNIDALAKEGCQFTDGYVSAPVCAPSRAGIITGRYQTRFGFETQEMEFYPANMIEYLSGRYLVNIGDWVVSTKPRYPREWQIAKQGVPPTEIELGEVMKKMGYTTGVIGKWHLGSNPKYQTPLKRGFDYSYGCLGAFTLYGHSADTKGLVNFRSNSFSTKYQWDMGRSENGAIVENGRTIKKEEGYLTDHIAENTISFIKRNKDKPFFLYVPFTAPHEPFQAKEADYNNQKGKTKDEGKAVYWGIIDALDKAVGDIHKTVKELGLEKNTIIYFLSDNGPASYTGIPDCGPLKGGKLTQFEGGINVPFIMKWKGKIQPGTKFDYPVISLDIFSTSVAAAKGALPTDRKIDGVNLLPYINGEQKGRPHEMLYWKADHINVIRKGDYKLILSTRDNWIELYNLKTDKGETKDLSKEMPEKVKELSVDFYNWRTTLPKKPMWPRIMDHKFNIRGKDYLFPA